MGSGGALSGPADKDLLKRSLQCMELIFQAKERQAQEANRVANSLLKEIECEKSREQSKKLAAQRKREKRKLKRQQQNEELVSREEREESERRQERERRQESERRRQAQRRQEQGVAGLGAGLKGEGDRKGTDASKSSKSSKKPKKKKKSKQQPHQQVIAAQAGAPGDAKDKSEPSKAKWVYWRGAFGFDKVAGFKCIVKGNE